MWVSVFLSTMTNPTVIAEGSRQVSHHAGSGSVT
jgi:hypothetical protein